MKVRCTNKSWIGVVMLAAAGAFALGFSQADAPETGNEPSAPPSFEPTERIDVEQAVDFPYDI